MFLHVIIVWCFVETDDIEIDAIEPDANINTGPTFEERMKEIQAVNEEINRCFRK